MSAGGKGVFGKSSLITMQISGWMTAARVVRCGSAKPEARVERMEMMAMRVNFIVGMRWRCFLCWESGGYIKVRRRFSSSDSSR